MIITLKFAISTAMTTTAKNTRVCHDDESREILKLLSEGKIQ